MKWLLIAVFFGAVWVVNGRDATDARIVAARSTKTAIVLTTSTTTTPYTCSVAAETPICLRRRYKRYTNIDDVIEQGYKALDGSINSDNGEEAGSNRDGRVAFIIWTTTSSTFTVTATSTNQSLTFSLSFYCSISGASYPPACAG